MDDRRHKNGSDRRNGDNRREIVPLRRVEEVISYDTLSTVEHLTDATRTGDCLGIAFAAILRGGRSIHGHTGAAIEQPDLAAGLLGRVIKNIYKYSEDSGP
jgi:hypothetical protein